MSLHRLVALHALAALLLTSAACGDDDGASSPPDPDAAVGADATTTADAAPVAASWDIESNLTVNGQRLDEGIQSVVARHHTFDSGPGLDVRFTSAPDYCALLRNDGCIEDGAVLVSLSVFGTEPGTYTLGSSVEGTAGTFSLIYRTIERDCTGAGLGPSEGTLTITHADDGAVSLDFDTALSFVGASANIGGTLTAPFCD